ASACTDAFALFGGSNSRLVHLFLSLVPLQALSTELKISAACTRFSPQNTSVSFVRFCMALGLLVRIREGWSGYFNIGIRASRVVDQARLEGGCISLKSRTSACCTALSNLRGVRLVGTHREGVDFFSFNFSKFSTANEASLFFGGLHNNVVFCSDMIWQ
ncbi:hypothetical protein EDD22DRAFT_917132, partial [Suillus occidentalis]